MTREDKLRSCVPIEIHKHCRKKSGRGCKIKRVRKQAIAIAFSICRRKARR